jgi:hypothetical protein
LVVNISHFLGLGQKKIRIPNSYNTNDLGILTKLLNIFNKKQVARLEELLMILFGSLMCGIVTLN